MTEGVDGNGVDAGGRALCSAVSSAAGEDMIGTAWSPEAMALIESPLPWPADAKGALGGDVWRVWQRQWAEGLRAYFLAIVPDAAYGPAGGARVIWLRRPGGMFAAYERREFVAPRDRAPALLAWLCGTGEYDAAFAAYEVAESGARDLLMCTHGSVDACCGRLGYPAYRSMRQWADASAGAVRVWRASHFGGHRFAPTALELPAMRFWGRLDEAAMAMIVRRRGVPERLSRHYRGASGLADPAVSVVDRELLLRMGWRWLDIAKRGEVLCRDERAGTMAVRIEYRDPHGEDEGAFVASVVCTGSVALGGCGLEAGHEAPQYRVKRLTRVVRHVAMTAAG